ncbi:MAG: PEGA domain-containing protein, partial [Candidatus Eisenbacteria bacterium]|nr:PEGA domain-containing protein [Candidatus Eisenbacteria bacterium]
SEWLIDFVRAIAEAYTDLSVYKYPGDGFGSDHVPFHNHGYPAVLSIENEWDSYPCYHSACDTVGWLDADLWRGITAANVVSLAQLAGAQASAGAIDGTVLVEGGGDPGGAVLTLAGTGYTVETSDPAGAFGWSGIFPGTYTLTAEKSGYVSAETEVAVTDGGTAQVEIVLEPLSSDVEPPAGTTRPLSLQVAPNPALTETIVRLYLPRPIHGSLSVCAVDGRRVATLLSSGPIPAGEHVLTWNGRDDRGRPTGAGIYLIRLQAGSLGVTERLVRID